jgi:hypothetical protein
MRDAWGPVIVLGLSIVGGARLVGAPPTPTPTPMAAEESVTVPSLPDQPNKEGVVRPDGRLTTDPDGHVLTNPAPVQPTDEPSVSSPPPGPVLGGPLYSKAPPRARGAAMSTVSVRAVVKAIQAGTSVTLRFPRRSRTLTYSLAPEAFVPDDLKPGETVRVRILANGKKRVVDQIERIAGKS